MIKNQAISKPTEPVIRSDISYIMDGYSPLSPNSKGFYRDFNEQMNQIILSEKMKKALEKGNLRPPSSMGSFGERSYPATEHQIIDSKFRQTGSTWKGGVYSVGTPNAYHPESRTSLIEKSKLKTPEEVFKPHQFPLLDFKRKEMINQVKEKKETRGSFLETLMLHNEIMPQDNDMLVDLMSKVPGAMTEGPVGRKTAILTKEWIEKKKDQNGGLCWGAAELAIVEIARQTYINCSERGECILLALSAYKKTLEERETNRVADVKMLKERLKTSTNEVIASIQARETQLVVQLSEALSEKKGLADKLEQMEAELESKSNAIERYILVK